MAAQAADPNNYVVIEHTPPPSAVPGDALVLTATFQYKCPLFSECRDSTQRLVYKVADGTTKSTEVALSRPRQVEVWTVTLPADAVRFPAVTYHFEVDFNVYWIGPDNTSAYSDRSPALGEYTIAATPVVRMKFTMPNDVPASNLPVEIAGPSADALWRTTTDGTGLLKFQVPVEHPAIQRVIASGERQVGLRVTVSAIPRPGHNPAAGSPVDAAGLASLVAVQLNLGRSELPAVDTLSQDRTFRLRQITQTYYHPSDVNLTGASAGSSSEGCQDTYFGRDRMRRCLYKWHLGADEIRVASNLGGGRDIRGRYSYTNNIRTSTTRGISLKRGEWFETEGKTTAEKTSEIKTTTQWIGPFASHDFEVLMMMVMDEEYTCYYSDGRSQPDFCNGIQDVHQGEWTGGTDTTAPPSYRLFDLACNPQTDGRCSDFTVQFNGSWDGKQGTSTGMEYKFMVSIPYSPMELTAQTAHTHENGSTTEVDFEVVQSNYRYHFVSVEEGAAKGKTPTNSPEWTYTSASNSDLTNVIARSDGCPPICPAT